MCSTPVVVFWTRRRECDSGIKSKKKEKTLDLIRLSSSLTIYPLSVFLPTKMSNGPSRATDGGGESEKQPWHPPGNHHVMPHWPHKAPRGRHLEQEVHLWKGPVCTAVALPDAGGRGSAGGSGQADTVLSTRVLRDVQWGCRRQDGVQTYTGTTVRAAAQVQ